MKAKTSQQIKVGIFVFVGLVLAMVVIFLLGDGFTLFQRRYTLYSRFDDTSGLRVGAPVYLAGIQVGKVEKLSFPKDLEQRYIQARLEIKKEFQDRIRQDSSSSIVTQGLLGDKAILISVGSASSPELKDEEILPFKQGVSIEGFAKQGGDLLESLNKLSNNINGLVSDVKEKPGMMHAMIYDPRGKNVVTLVEDLSKMTENTNKIVTEIQSGQGILHALVYDPVNKDMGKTFSELAKNLESFSSDLKEVGNRIEQGEGSVGALIKDPTLYYDLMTLIGKANRNKLLRTVIRATLAGQEKKLIEK